LLQNKCDCDTKIKVILCIYGHYSISSPLMNTFHYVNKICLNVFHLLARKPNLEKKMIFIHTKYFIIFTCLNPVLLVPGMGQVISVKTVLTYENVNLTFLNGLVIWRANY
jgi:hypothetical protein